jgi:F-type H+-transporting ATPase subunit b
MLEYLAVEGGEHTQNPVVPIWQEVVIGTIAFAVLVFILGKFVWPRMEATFQARVDAIEGGIKKAEDAQREAVGIREDATNQAREESDRIIQAGRDALAAERGQIVRELRAELGTLAVDLASRIVGEALADEARQRGTVERFLDELGDAGGRTVPAGGKR